MPIECGYEKSNVGKKKEKSRKLTWDFDIYARVAYAFNLGNMRENKAKGQISSGSAGASERAR